MWVEAALGAVPFNSEPFSQHSTPRRLEHVRPDFSVLFKSPVLADMRADCTEGGSRYRPAAQILP